MSTLTAPTCPPLADFGRATHHRRIVERTVTVTRELVVDGEQSTTTVTGLDGLVLRLALWLIDRRRVRALRVQVDPAEMSRRVDEAKRRHIDRYHGLPF